MNRFPSIASVLKEDHKTGLTSWNFKLAPPPPPGTCKNNLQTFKISLFSLFSFHLLAPPSLFPHPVRKTENTSGNIYHLLSHTKPWKLPPVFPPGRLGWVILHWYGMLHFNQSYFHTHGMDPSLFVPYLSSWSPYKVTDFFYFEQIVLWHLSAYMILK